MKNSSVLGNKKIALFKLLAGIIMLLQGLNSCNSSVQKNDTISNTKNSSEDVSGNYVTDDYLKRNEGYDWVAVIVKPKTDSTIIISIRSRIDKKKPTCTFDAEATRTDNNIYLSDYEGLKIKYVFTADSVTIAALNKVDNDRLYFFCSGGATIAGSYKKINEPLDKDQLDPVVFHKLLTLQNIGFNISSTGEGSIQNLKIQPFGLEIDNSEINNEITGIISNAEIEDLNSDGYPELLIYTVSAGSGSYGNVIGYSVNNGKSISQISFPDIMDNPEASDGYMGHDEFYIIETTLVRRFRTYEDGDINAQPTGKMRQIQYKLKVGENSRQFVIDKIVEYDVD